MECEIRPVEAADFDEIARLTVAAYRHGGHLGGDVASYEAQLRDVAGRAQHSELLAAVDGARVLGAVAVCVPGSKLCEVSRPGELEFRMLAVDPAEQGRGVGEALVRACLQRGRSLGCHAVVMCSREDVSLGAHRLYRRIGFVRVPDRDWSPLAGVPLIAWSASL